jgi:hypothetical protein
MYRWTSAAALFVLGVVALGGCKQKEPDPQSIPVPTGTSAATVAADPGPTGAQPAGAGADAGDADAAALVAPTTTTQPATPSEPATPKSTGGGSIDACCSALAAIQRSGKSGVTKQKAAAAAAVCGGIAKRVKAGETSRAAALTQIRSAMVGAEVPGECK